MLSLRSATDAACRSWGSGGHKAVGSTHSVCGQTSARCLSAADTWLCPGANGPQPLIGSCLSMDETRVGDVRHGGSSVRRVDPLPALEHSGSFSCSPVGKGSSHLDLAWTSNKQFFRCASQPACFIDSNLDDSCRVSFISESWCLTG